MSDNPHEQQKMLTLVKLTNQQEGKFELHLDQLEEILRQRGWLGKKIVVIGIAGKFRTGKSFQLNLALDFQRLLAGGHPGHPGNWLAPGTTVSEGIPWRGGAKRDTSGILAWHEPFLVKNVTSGEEMVLLLLDSQGLWDLQTKNVGNTQLFVLSALLASTMIFNVLGQFQQHESDELKNFVTFARSVAFGLHQSNSADENGLKEKLFQEMLFLIRDWNYDYEHAYGFAGGKEYVEGQLHNRTPASSGESASDVFAICDTIRCFLMPSPGDDVAEGRFRGNADVLDHDFVEQQRLFLLDQLSPEKMSPKCFAGQQLTCASWLGLFKEFGKIMLSGKMPETYSFLEVSAKISHDIALQAAVKFYRNKMDQMTNISKNQPSEFALLAEAHKHASEESIAMFISTKKLSTSDEMMSTEFKTKLQAQINEIYTKDFMLKNKILLENIEKDKAAKIAADQAKEKQEEQKIFAETAKKVDETNAHTKHCADEAAAAAKRQAAGMDELIKNSKAAREQSEKSTEYLQKAAQKSEEGNKEAQLRNEQAKISNEAVQKAVQSMEQQTETIAKAVVAGQKRSERLEADLAQAREDNSGGFWKGLATVGAGIAGFVAAGPVGAVAAVSATAKALEK